MRGNAYTDKAKELGWSVVDSGADWDGSPAIMGRSINTAWSFKAQYMADPADVAGSAAFNKAMLKAFVEVYGGTYNNLEDAVWMFDEAADTDDADIFDEALDSMYDFGDAERIVFSPKQ